MQESETLSICPHGCPVKFNCAKCMEEAGKDQFLSQIPSSISANLCKHGIYLYMQQCFWCELQSMIDKVSDRLKICEELVIALCDPDKIMANEKHIIERIEKLEKWLKIVNEEHVFLKSNYSIPLERMIEDNVNNLFSKIKDIEEKILSMNSQISLAFHQINDLYNIEEKMDFEKPHKCPVCDGSGKDYSHGSITHGKDTIGYHGQYSDCHACKGKGVLWK